MNITPRSIPPEPTLNLTPMIDVTFQLILFFLFSLRFKSLDYRLETRLPDEMGILAIPTSVVPPPAVTARLVRLDAENLAAARTRVRVGAQEWTLPDPARGDPAEREAIVDRIAARLRELRERDPGLRGKIEAPLPMGALVPHGDVVSVLDAFVQASYEDVNFVGAPFPRPLARSR